MLRKGARLIIKPHQLIGKKVLPRPAVILVRHNDLKGPIHAFLSLPDVPHVWVLDRFFSFRQCYEQYRCYTFSVRQGKKIKPFSLKAFIAAAVVVPLVKASGAVAVYRGKREIFQTLEESLKLLKQGHTIVIAADKDYADTLSPVKEIYTGFFRLEQLYYDSTGEHIPFIAVNFQKNGSMICSETMYFSDEIPFRPQRKILTAKIIDFFNESDSLCNIPSSYNKSS